MLGNRHWVTKFHSHNWSVKQTNIKEPIWILQEEFSKSLNDTIQLSNYYTIYGK